MIAFSTISLVGGHIFGAIRQNNSPGAAVNETLVLAFVALFALNVVLTTIRARFGTGHRHHTWTATPP